MSNVELFYKVHNVIKGCQTKEQFYISKNYVRLADRFLCKDWELTATELGVAFVANSKQVLHYLIRNKERELFSK